ncbi:MAG: metallophosphoesterase family protein [Desulfovibrionaceae bacterium]|nr:metallophosphoesterase family protein [Desulfovibrionaceae bacterium]MBF0513205.1 metallophosphoesterase family protein [Desulfovibrionaceae bacterium]
MAVLSDIHGNIEALRAVFVDIDALGVTDAVSLGDNVGYGPRPEEVVALLRERAVPSVMGNHEAGLSFASRLSWFNPTARKALDITRSLVSADTLAYLAGLPDHLAANGLRFVHGAPPRAMNAYLYELGEKQLAGLFRLYPERTCFAGHTHDLKLYVLRGDTVEKRRFADGQAAALEPGVRQIVNAGSVGQPRDGDHRAKYLIYDRNEDSVAVRRLEYDIEKTAREIIERGIPETYARRLGQG